MGLALNSSSITTDRKANADFADDAEDAEEQLDGKAPHTTSLVFLQTLRKLLAPETPRCRLNSIGVRFQQQGCLSGVRSRRCHWSLLQFSASSAVLCVICVPAVQSK